MAYYYLTALYTDAATLRVLGRRDYCFLGSVLSEIFRKAAAPGKGNLSSAARVEPVDIDLGGRKVGQFLGFHYDGSPTGTRYAQAPLAPPQSVVFSTLNSDMDRHLHYVTSSGAKRIILGLVEKGMSLEEAWRKVPARLTTVFSCLRPVLYNDTDDPAPVRVLKFTAFREGEEALMLHQGGYPSNFPSGFKPLERVSELGRPALLGHPA